MTRFASERFSLGVRSNELKKGPTRLKVPDQSIEILKALLERPGELVTREQLRGRLWPADTFVDFKHGLNAAVRRLREALGDSAETPKFIETLPRRGYRFIAAVDQPAPVAPAPGSAIEAEAVTVAPAAEPPPRPGAIRRRYAAGAALMVLAAGSGVWMAGQWRETAPVQSAASRSLPVTTYAGLELAPELSPDGHYAAFAWDRDVAGKLDIYVKLIGGGAPVRVATDDAAEFSPAWSPNGRRLAFLRPTEAGSQVLVIPALGGPERIVTETRIPPLNRNEISWTPDGRSLVIIDRGGSSDAAVFLCSVETGERWALTQPTRDFADASPVVSRDGRYLAFVRRIAAYTQGSVFLQRLDRLRPVGEPTRLTYDDHTSTLDWAYDSGSIVYDITGGSRTRGLWQVPLSGGEPRPIVTNVPAQHPSVARDGTRLLYSNGVFDANIWRVPGPAAHRGGKSPAAPVQLIASTFRDHSPQFSARGDRIAFVSYRSGTAEIWAARSDGLQEMQLTAFGGAYTGTPRWSPDGNSVAFDSMRSGSWNIYVVGSQGGAVRSITRDASNNARASWSRDGKWIYFGSNRAGNWQIWKASVAGGAPVQITRQGGMEAFESPDGRYLYYAKPGRQEGIWQVPVDGGNEVQILDRGAQTSWGVTDRGIVIMHKRENPATIEFFDVAAQRITTIARLGPGLRFDRPNPSLAVSRDGQWILYVQFDRFASDLEMIELR